VLIRLAYSRAAVAIERDDLIFTQSFRSCFIGGA
jgi:hypothetical protein